MVKRRQDPGLQTKFSTYMPCQVLVGAMLDKKHHKWSELLCLISDLSFVAGIGGVLY